MDQTLSKVTLEADKRSRRPGHFLGKLVWGDVAAAVSIWRLSY